MRAVGARRRRAASSSAAAARRGSADGFGALGARPVAENDSWGIDPFRALHFFMLGRGWWEMFWLLDLLLKTVDLFGT